MKWRAKGLIIISQECLIVTFIEVWRAGNNDVKFCKSRTYVIVGE